MNARHLIIASAIAGTACGRDPVRSPEPNATRPAFVFSYASGNDAEASEIARVSDDGSVIGRVVDLVGADIHPAVAPSGRSIAFANRTTAFDDYRLYVIGINGTGLRRLTPDTLSALGPAWSPDERQIAFNYQTTQYDWGVAVVNTDGSALRIVAGADHADATAPSWSPDRMRLAFSRVGEIWIVKVDGSAAERITAGPCDWGPRWSPDGKWIAFIAMTPRCPPDSAGVMVIRPDGTGRRRLAAGGWLDIAWSPDGSGLVADDRPIGGPGFLLLSPWEAAPRRIAVRPPRATLFPDWLPAR